MVIKTTTEERRDYVLAEHFLNAEFFFKGESVLSLDDDTLCSVLVGFFYEGHGAVDESDWELDLDGLCAYIEDEIARWNDGHKRWYPENKVSKCDLRRVLKYVRKCQRVQSRRKRTPKETIRRDGTAVARCTFCCDRFHFTGMVYSYDPPRFLHLCNNCGEYEVLTKKYD